MRGGDSVGQPTPGALGRFIREQRQLARLSLREMARMASVSNAYLSQVERGLHEPSIRVLNALADVLDVPIEDMVGGNAERGPEATGEDASVESAVRRDPRLTAEQKDALLGVYRSYLGETRASKPRAQGA
jgi:transcriptional regulator with XRE-family HTH domain